jgi:serine/threonine protein kinase
MPVDLLPTFQKHANDEPIPGYRLIEPLGRGGFGEVWKCEAPGGLIKAIKFVPGSDGVLDAACGAEQELRALQHVKSIRHPFLLSLDRVEFLENELIIVMEVADHSLLDLLRAYQARGQVGLPREELLCYMRETAEVLDLMNLEYGLQHLDIKPGNLFLVRSHIKVADFGLVNSLADLNGQHAGSFRLGAITPLYASPESFQGKITLHSDQYSLAVVYHELLTGTHPFDGRNFRQLALQHSAQAPDLSRLPEEDRPFVARALAKDPRKRFASCSDFVNALVFGDTQSKPSLIDTRPDSRQLRTVSVAELSLSEPFSEPLARTSASRPTRQAPSVRLPVAVGPPSGRAGDSSAPSIDDFQLLDCLGRGQLGEMWKAETPEGDLQLVKLVSSPAAGAFGEASPLRRFQALRHEGLTPLRVLPREPNHIALVSDFPGDNLGTRLQECQRTGLQGIPRRELLGYLARVAGALDDLYQQHRLQHLGLTPHNLWLVEGEVQIADFGLMELVWLPDGQQVGQINPRYSAPELFHRAPGRHCDQYSLGIIYHELLTGMHPLRNVSARQLAQMRGKGTLDLDMLPAPDRPVLTRALNPDPQLRFHSCSEFIEALNSAIPGQGYSDVAPEPEVHDDEVANLVLDPDVMRLAVAELIEQAGGGAKIKTHNQFHYLLLPERALFHRCQARVPTSTARFKLDAFRQQWSARLIEQSAECYVYQVGLKSSLWQRCLRQQPVLETRVQFRPPREAHETLSEVYVEVIARHCGSEQAAEVLTQQGLPMIESLRHCLQVGPERRESPRLPLDRSLKVRPVLDEDRVGDALLVQTKDVSTGGLGLYLPHRPATNFLLVQLPYTGEGGAQVGVPAEVKRIVECGNGSFEVGLRFVIA